MLREHTYLTCSVKQGNKQTPCYQILSPFQFNFVLEKKKFQNIRRFLFYKEIKYFFQLYLFLNLCEMPKNYSYIGTERVAKRLVDDKRELTPHPVSMAVRIVPSFIPGIKSCIKSTY